MGYVRLILHWALTLFLLALFIRLIFDWAQVLNREYRPRGALLILADVVYRVTDPPVKFARRYIKPIKAGPAAIDVSFMVVMFLTWLLLRFV